MGKEQQSKKETKKTTAFVAKGKKGGQGCQKERQGDDPAGHSLTAGIWQGARPERSPG